MRFGMMTSAKTRRSEINPYFQIEISEAVHTLSETQMKEKERRALRVVILAWICDPCSPHLLPLLHPFGFIENHRIYFYWTIQSNVCVGDWNFGNFAFGDGSLDAVQRSRFDGD